MRRLVPVVVFALAALAAPSPGATVTAGNVSVCADAFSGGVGGCGFQYAGVRVLVWAVAAPGAGGITVEARYPHAGGTSSLIAECSVSGGSPVCYGEPLSKPATPSFQTLQCIARGTGRAVFGCVSQRPIL